MDKEKQIDYKKMANTCRLYTSCNLCPYRPEDISIFIGKRWEGGCPDYDRQLVYAMGKGYRKINENEVVISKEEYEKLKILKEGHITCEDLLEFVNSARKEMVKDVLNCIKELYKNPYSRFHEDILKVAEKYGVDLGEEK